MVNSLPWISSTSQKTPPPLLCAKMLAQMAMEPKTTIIEEQDKEGLNQMQNPTENNEILLAYMEEIQRPNEIKINAKTSNAIKFHLKHDKKKENLPFKQLIPEMLHNYFNVFNENKAERFPGPRPWDHRIELKEGFEPKSFKTYNLTPEEQRKLDQWLKENSEKGYIQPSQSPM